MLVNHFILHLLYCIYINFISLNFQKNYFLSLRFFFFLFLLSTFRILHFVFFKFLLTLGSLRVFNFIFSTLGNLVFNLFFGVKFGSLWFWFCEHPQFSIFFLSFWGSSFYLSRKGMGSLDFILWTLWHFLSLFQKQFGGLQFSSCHFCTSALLLWNLKVFPF